MIRQVQVTVNGQGLYDIGNQVAEVVATAGLNEGLCTLFIRHTSASLLNKLVPQDDPDYTHTIEGPDDMPAHIKSAITATSVSIPIGGGLLMLGTWQGVFLWEHRHRPGQREVVIHIRD